MMENTEFQRNKNKGHKRGRKARSSMRKHVNWNVKRDNGSNKHWAGTVQSGKTDKSGEGSFPGQVFLRYCLGIALS